MQVAGVKQRDCHSIVIHYLLKGDCDYKKAVCKHNDEEWNRIFLDIIGRQDKLTPEVEDKDVAVRKADLGQDIRSFISYAVY